MQHTIYTLQKRLKEKISGEMRFDNINKKIYSIDASIYELEPLGIVIPRDEEDLFHILQIADEFKIPVTARGAATGITGACLGKGLIVDTSRYLNRILKIDIDGQYAVCQPGVVQDRLNEALSPHGYRLGPDTSTGNRATLGGMLANNSAGARSLVYGSMRDHIQEVKLALAGGDLFHCLPLEEEAFQAKLQLPTREGHIYRKTNQVLGQFAADIRAYTPDIPRHVSGYNLKGLLEDPSHNLSKLIAGSEGTLGIVTEMKVKISLKPRCTGLCLIAISTLIPALKHIPQMLSYHPLSLEMIDNRILTAAAKTPLAKSTHWLDPDAQAIFIAEFEGANLNEVREKLHHFSQAMKKAGFGYQVTLLTDQNEMQSVWDVRKAGLGLLLSKRSYSRAIAFIEDLSIAPERLAPFMQEFTEYLATQGKQAGIYGHIGSGCMHIRPYIDLRDPHEVILMRQMMVDVARLVKKYKGAMSGEHGDGLIRSWLNESFFGNALYQAFIEVKEAFDPHHRMNPGKIVRGPSPTENLRLSPETPVRKITTFLDFSEEGGIELAVDLCNGNGQCRKAEGVMCPSFQVSGDEYDTTRARAQALRNLIQGKIDLKSTGGKEIHGILDLCIECKGCKRECPSQVDMAKMKSEFLHAYQEQHGYLKRNRLFADLRHHNTRSSQAPQLFNFLANSSFGNLFKIWVVITTKRPLPELAHETFTVWFEKQPQTHFKKTVILFVDTYTQYNEPSIGKAACTVLNALRYNVRLVSQECCGRPLLSKGFLTQAKEQAQKLVNALSQSSQLTHPIIFLEPSCASAVRDDYQGLLGRQGEAYKTVRAYTYTLDEFLQNHLSDPSFKEISKRRISEEVK